MGSRLVEAAVEQGRRRALRYLSVHPTPQIVVLYHRLGFAGTRRALEPRLDGAQVASANAQTHDGRRRRGDCEGRE